MLPLLHARVAIACLLAFAVACSSQPPAGDASGASANVGEANASETAAQPATASRELQRLRAQLVMQVALDPLIRADQFDVNVVGDSIVVVANGPDSEAIDRVAAIAAQLQDGARIRVEGATGANVEVSLRDAATELADEIARATRPEVEPELVVEGSGAAVINRAASGDRPRSWRVRPGDTLSLIAARTMGDGNAWQRIYEYNRSMIGANPERLREGMELRIPQD